MTSRERLRPKVRKPSYHLCAILVLLVPASANAQAEDAPIDLDRAAD